jgi:hypothetical protein
MIEAQFRTSEHQLLMDFLQAQRGAVLAIVEGLNEEPWYGPVGHPLDSWNIWVAQSDTGA